METNGLEGSHGRNYQISQNSPMIERRHKLSCVLTCIRLRLLCDTIHQLQILEAPNQRPKSPLPLPLRLSAPRTTRRLSLVHTVVVL